MRELQRDDRADRGDGEGERGGIWDRERGDTDAERTRDDGRRARQHDDVCAVRRHPERVSECGERATHKDRECSRETSGRPCGDADPRRGEGHVVPRDRPLIGERERHGRGVRDGEDARKDDDVAPVDPRVPDEQPEEKDEERRLTSRADPPAPQPEERQHEERGHDDHERARYIAGKRETRKIDARHAHDAHENDRRRDAGGHREKSAQALALAALLGAIAPRDERIKPGEERGADGRGEHDTGTHRCGGDRIEAE